MNKALYTIDQVLLSLKKHKLLHYNLVAYGVRGTELSLFTHYLLENVKVTLIYIIGGEGCHSVILKLTSIYL